MAVAVIVAVVAAVVVVLVVRNCLGYHRLRPFNSGPVTLVAVVTVVAIVAIVAIIAVVAAVFAHSHDHCYGRHGPYSNHDC